MIDALSIISDISMPALFVLHVYISKQFKDVHEKINKIDNDLHRLQGKFEFMQPFTKP